jgi:predicted transcriptional regulator
MTVQFSITMDEAVKARLDALADARRVPLDAVVAEAVTALANQDDCFLTAVDQGLASLAAGRVSSHEDVVSRLRQRQAGRARQA